MAKIEDDSPMFENLELSGGEAADEEVVADQPAVESEIVEIEADQLAELPPVEEAPAEPPAPEPEPVAEPEEKPVPKAAREKSDGASRLVPVAVAVGLPVILLGLAAVGFLFFSTAIYVTAMGCTFLGLWTFRKTNTLYTVLLACTLAAVLTAVYCLWIEMGEYKFDVKAKGAKQRISAAWQHPAHGDLPVVGRIS